MKKCHNFSLREKTLNALKEYAEETGHSMSLIVDLAVEKYLKEKKKVENA